MAITLKQAIASRMVSDDADPLNYNLIVDDKTKDASDSTYFANLMWLINKIKNNTTLSVIGTITSTTQTPTGSETTGQAYGLGDAIIEAAASGDVVLGGTFGTVPKGTGGGWVRKQSDGTWTLEPIKIDLSGYTKELDFEPVKDYTEQLQQSIYDDGDEDVPYAIKAGTGEDILKVLSDGSIDIAKLLVQNGLTIGGNADLFFTKDYLFVLCDSAGTIIYAVKNDLTVLNGLASGLNSSALKAFGLPSYSYMIGIGGQSLAEGGQSVMITNEAIYGAFSFTHGAEIVSEFNTASDRLSSLIPLGSVANVYNTESPLYGFANKFIQSILKAGGKDFIDNGKLIVASSAIGGAPYYQLKKGTAAYNDMLDAITAAKILSGDANFAMPVYIWEHGSASQGQGYSVNVGDLQEHFTNVKADIPATTGQSLPLKVITCQESGWTIPGANSHFPVKEDGSYNDEDLVLTDETLALGYVGLNTSDVYLSNPQYMFDYLNSNNSTDPVGTDYRSPHLTAECNQWQGAYFAHVAKKIIVDKTEWKPLCPIAMWISGNDIYVKFHVPYGGLTVDKDWVTDAGNLGFRLFTSNSGGAEATISSAEVISFDTVKITAAASPLGLDLGYALLPEATGNGRTIGHRGNLRDTYGDVEFYEPVQGGNKYPLHNWCVMFRQTLPTTEGTILNINQLPYSINY